MWRGHLFVFYFFIFLFFRINLKSFLALRFVSFKSLVFNVHSLDLFLFFPFIAYMLLSIGSFSLHKYIIRQSLIRYALFNLIERHHIPCHTIVIELEFKQFRLHVLVRIAYSVRFSCFAFHLFLFLWFENWESWN